MANLRVLIADSDASFRARAQHALTRQGYFVVPAADGNEALARMENGPLDVLVAQVGLPEQDGLELLTAAQNKSARLPVILLAEPRDIGAAAIGVRAGAFDYLVKPLDDMTRLALMIDRAAGLSPSPSMPALPPVSIGPVATSAVVSPETGVDASPPQLLDALVTGQNLNAVLEQYAAELARLTRAAHTLVLLGQNDGQLHFTAAHGYTSRAEAGLDYTNAIGEVFAWRVAGARDLTWQTNSTNGRGGRRGESGPTLGLPLLFKDQVLGVAIAHLTAPRESIVPASLVAIQQLTQQVSLGIELARLSARVKRLEPRDTVTGLVNREHFFEMADRDFRRAWRFNHGLCVLVLDIDDFGKLHLLLGPQESDRVIQQVAHVTRTHVRSVDLVGRLDTDTLGIVLLMAKKDHALGVAERLRRLIAEVQVETPEDIWQVTASCGIAAYPRDNCPSVFDLFALADQALRRAKRAGRNRMEAV